MSMTLLVDTKNLYVVTDFCSGGSLLEYLESTGPFVDTKAQFVAAQLVLAIHYIHEQGGIHCNLLPENILLDEQGYIRITGFSELRLCQTSPYYKMIGYLECMSPEMLLNQGIDSSYDWYLLGCLLYGTFS